MSKTRNVHPGFLRRAATMAVPLGISLLISACLNAESLHLSLREAVGRALSDGTAVRIATERIDRSQAQANQARSALLPQVSGQVVDYNQVLNLKTFGLT